MAHALGEVSIVCVVFVVVIRENCVQDGAPWRFIFFTNIHLIVSRKITPPTVLKNLTTNIIWNISRF